MPRKLQCDTPEVPPAQEKAVAGHDDAFSSLQFA